MGIQIPENLRKQLALAVRSIQWSYAIFWSTSDEKPGVLEWGDGYYNGDIKTRKTVQTVELNADHLGLQRSDQLRELFESLQAGETNPQAKRPTAALSPEDLTDAEWYFLVCMSFVFNMGQGLPGRTLAKNQTIWLCNAHRADTKIYSRSLLSKSASIKTVVCFPHLGGVVELGATELVSEDPDLIRNLKTSFLECPPTNFVSEPLDLENMSENNIDRFLDCPDLEIHSPENSSNDFLQEETNLVEPMDGEASQIHQSWPFVDEAISNGLNNNNNNNNNNHSTNSSDCISQNYENGENEIPLPYLNNAINDCTHLQSDDVHYQSVLSNLLKSSHQLILGPYFRNGNRKSSFVGWKTDGPSGSNFHTGKRCTSQSLLKKVLFEVSRMHQCQLESDKQKGKKEGPAKPDLELDIDRNHVLSERKRREKINERFTILGSLVPSGGKVDKVSILDHTIEYLRDLERKVEDLESYKNVVGLESRAQTKPHDDAIERTSDNYGPSKIGGIKKPLTNKRKAIDKRDEIQTRVRLRDSPTDNVSVNVSGKDVSIEIKCAWRECLLIEFMEALNKQQLDSQSVQSSNTDGILSISVKAKSKGLKVASVGMIKQALQKVIRKC